MFFAPLTLPFSWLLGLLSLALLGGGVYLLWAWYVGAVVGTSFLVASVAMLVWTFAGRWIVLRFRPSGDDEPRGLRPDSVVRLRRPDGAVLHVDRTGRPTRQPSS